MILFTKMCVLDGPSIWAMALVITDAIQIHPWFADTQGSIAVYIKESSLPIAPTTILQWLYVLLNSAVGMARGKKRAHKPEWSYLDLHGFLSIMARNGNLPVQFYRDDRLLSLS